MDPRIELDVAAAIRKVDARHDLGAAQLAESVLAELNDLGYAVVKLPEQGFDGMGQPCWQVADGSHWDPRVTVQQPHGRIVLDGVPMAFHDPQVALSLASALIAAALHHIEKKQATA